MSGQNTGLSDDMRLLLALCLGLLLVITGCASLPFSGTPEQEKPISVNVTNSANVTHTFEVWVVELGATVTIRRNTSYDYKADIDEGLSTRDPGPSHPITAVEFPASAQLHGRYTLKPGETDQTSITEYPKNPAVVVVIYHGNRVIRWISANCGDSELAYLGVFSQYNGSTSEFVCDL